MRLTDYSVPLNRPVGGNALQDSTKESEEVTVMSGEKILLVEDDPKLLRLFQDE
jgi:hypothetical protein